MTDKDYYEPSGEELEQEYQRKLAREEYEEELFEMQRDQMFEIQ